MRDAHVRFTVLAVAAAVALAVLAVWGIRLVVEVGDLRAGVEARVGWLRQISEIDVRGSEHELSADEWRSKRAQLEAVTTAMAQADPGPQASQAITEARWAFRAPPSTPAEADRAYDELNALVGEIRTQNASLSQQLGARWDAIHLLVVVSLFFATSTLGLLVYVRSFVLRRSQGEVAQLQSRLRTSDRLAAVGTLAAGVAHEINNPLTYITTNLQILREEVRSGDAKRDAAVAPILEDAIEGAERVSGIVKRLGTFGQVRPQDSDSAADLRDAIEQAIDLTGAEQEFAVDREYDALPRVRGDAAFHEEVLRTVIDNAIRAMKDHARPDHRLTIHAHVDGEARVRVTIADTGGGIPDCVRARLFEPFVTTREIGAGTGLGLFVAHSVVNAIGGDIDVESSCAGTVVTLGLPVA